MKVCLGKKIEIPAYTPEQSELWVDPSCPIYTGIMATVNNIAFDKHGCFIDGLTQDQKQACYDAATYAGPAWFEMPE